MEGVIDVLIGQEAKVEAKQDPSQWEIWDYKGQRRPKNGELLASYIYQMQVYAALFKLRNGCLPKAAKLYFLNELDTPEVNSRPPNAIKEVDFSSVEIDKAMSEFDSTARQIISSINNNNWPCPSILRAREMEETCKICDFRWSCGAWQNNKFPILSP